MGAGFVGGFGVGFDPPPVVGAAEAGLPPPPDDPLGAGAGAGFDPEEPLGAGAGFDPAEPLGVGGAGTGLHDGAAAELPVGVEYPPGLTHMGDVG